MRRMTGAFACVALLSASPAVATTDSLVTVIVPIENWQAGGYCRWEMLAADHITNGDTPPILVGKVLSRPIYTVAVVSNGTEPKVEQVDINPISGDPAITVEIDAERMPRIDIAIGRVPADAWQREMTLTRAKLALVFALKNLFVMNQCAKVAVTIQGLPEQDPGKVRLYERTQYPYTASSPHFRALIKELDTNEPCMAGRPLREPLQARKPRQRC